jgi:hypothetical protein
MVGPVPETVREECGAGRTNPHMKLISLSIAVLLASGICFSLFVRPQAIPAASGHTFELAKATKGRPTTKKPRKSRKKSSQNG